MKRFSSEEKTKEKLVADGLFCNKQTTSNLSFSNDKIDDDVDNCKALDGLNVTTTQLRNPGPILVQDFGQELKDVSPLSPLNPSYNEDDNENELFSNNNFLTNKIVYTNSNLNSNPNIPFDLNPKLNVNINVNVHCKPLYIITDINDHRSCSFTICNTFQSQKNSNYLINTNTNNNNISQTVISSSNFPTPSSCEIVDIAEFHPITTNDCIISSENSIISNNLLKDQKVEFIESQNSPDLPKRNSYIDRLSIEQITPFTDSISSNSENLFNKLNHNIIESTNQLEQLHLHYYYNQHKQLTTLNSKIRNIVNKPTFSLPLTSTNTFDSFNNKLNHRLKGKEIIDIEKRNSISEAKRKLTLNFINTLDKILSVNTDSESALTFETANTTPQLHRQSTTIIDRLQNNICTHLKDISYFSSLSSISSSTSPSSFEELIPSSLFKLSNNENQIEKMELINMSRNSSSSLSSSEHDSALARCSEDIGIDRKMIFKENLNEVSTTLYKNIPLSHIDISEKKSIDIPQIAPIAEPIELDNNTLLIENNNNHYDKNISCNDISSNSLSDTTTNLSTNNRKNNLNSRRNSNISLTVNTKSKQENDETLNAKNIFSTNLSPLNDIYNSDKAIWTHDPNITNNKKSNQESINKHDNSLLSGKEILFEDSPSTTPDPKYDHDFESDIELFQSKINDLKLSDNLRNNSNSSSIQSKNERYMNRNNSLTSQSSSCSGGGSIWLSNKVKSFSNKIKSISTKNKNDNPIIDKSTSYTTNYNNPNITEGLNFSKSKSADTSSMNNLSKFKLFSKNKNEQLNNDNTYNLNMLRSQSMLEKEKKNISSVLKSPTNFDAKQSSLKVSLSYFSKNKNISKRKVTFKEIPELIGYSGGDEFITSGWIDDCYGYSNNSDDLLDDDIDDPKYLADLEEAILRSERDMFINDYSLTSVKDDNNNNDSININNPLSTPPDTINLKTEYFSNKSPTNSTNSFNSIKKDNIVNIITMTSNNNMEASPIRFSLPINESPIEKKSISINSPSNLKNDIIIENENNLFNKEDMLLFVDDLYNFNPTPLGKQLIEIINSFNSNDIIKNAKIELKNIRRIEEIDIECLIEFFCNEKVEISKLSFIQIPLTPIQISNILSGLIHQPKLNSLTFDNVSKTKDGLKYICEFIYNKKSLHTIKLCDWLFDSFATQWISKSLENNNIENLILDRCKISTSAFGELSLGLLRCSSLKKLSLIDIGLKSDVIYDIAMLLDCNNYDEQKELKEKKLKLEKLYLDGNEFSKSLLILSNTINNSSLIELSLNHLKESMSSCDLAMFFLTLSNNKTIKSFSISNNSIKYEDDENLKQFSIQVCNSIGEVFIHNDTLNEINLKRIGIDDNCIDILSNSIIQNKSINKIIITDNKLSKEGIDKMCKIIKNRITSLSLYVHPQQQEH